MFGHESGCFEQFLCFLEQRGRILHLRKNRNKKTIRTPHGWQSICSVRTKDSDKFPKKLLPIVEKTVRLFNQIIMYMI